MTHLLPFLLFAFVASITPGPTNLLAMSSGARFGLRATLPIIAGGCIASAGLVLAAGLGMGNTLLAIPEVAQSLGWAGALWLTYLGWQIARASAEPAEIETASGSQRPLSGWAVALMQLINPKPWTVALAVVSVFMASANAPAWLLAALFLLIALPCMLIWAWLGSKASTWLHSPTQMRRFNQSMGLLLAASGWFGLLS